MINLISVIGSAAGNPGYVHTYELAPNSADAKKVWRRRQPNFGRRAAAPAEIGPREPDK